MRWSFRVARVFGIDIKLHLTFLLIVLWGAAGGASAAARAGYPASAGMLFGVVAVALLFTCVTLHELGHALTAMRFGVPVREIILLPIGGVAMLARSPSRGLHELLIAVAGPLVNVVILAVLTPLLMVTNGWDLSHLAANVWAFASTGRPAGTVSPLGVLLLLLFQANFWLIAFNMIPAFPLDGGRVLRSLLWMRMPMARATRIAATVGQVFAVLMGLYGLMFGGLTLVVIAVFIFLGAGAESAAAQAGRVLATRRVGDAYNKYAITLSMDDRVSRVIDYLLSSYQPDYAVVHWGRLQGVVTREDVLKWLAANHYDVYVTEIMHPDVLRVDAGLTLEQVRQSMGGAVRRVAAVYDGERYLGLVSEEDIAEAQLVLTFLQRGETEGGTRSVHQPRPGATEPVV